MLKPIQLNDFMVLVNHEPLFIMLTSSSFGQQPDALSIAFIDTSLSNTDVLLQGFRSDQITMLDDQSSGIEQISQALAQYDHAIESIHIFSPTNNSNLTLGNVHLNQNNINQYEDELEDWGEALTDKGDVLLYGSELAKKSAGRRLVRKIARLTDADVAASRDITGSQSLAGDWDLEYSKGKIESSFSPQGYEGLLLNQYADSLPSEHDQITKVSTVQPTPIDTNMEQTKQPKTLRKNSQDIAYSVKPEEAKHLTISQDNLLNIQFEAHSTGPYTEKLVDQDWKNVAWANLGDRARIVDDADTARGQVLEITYPKDAVGSRQGGSQFEVSLPESDELWLSYYVKFGEGFDFRRGGKLPGLTSGGSDYTGGRRPTHGEGWSARYMWRENGTAMAYPYYVDMSGKWGEDMPLKDIKFQPGQWHQMTQHIKLNTSNQANGVLETWVDGKKVQARSDLRLRLGNKGKIDSLYFSTFHGGKGADWAPRVDSKAFFDGFVVSQSAPDLLHP